MTGNQDGQHTTIAITEPKARIGDYDEAYLLQRAREMVNERTKNWEMTNLKAEERIPKFHRDEIDLGSLLGKGGFFEVSEVRKMTLRQDRADQEEPENDDKTDAVGHDEDYIQGVVQNRKFMQQFCVRNGKDCRYAFKTMQDICRNDAGVFVNTVVDLAIEFKFLSSVRHPNILKMRAVSAGDLFSSGSFLVLDRIYDTLLDRIEVWKKEDRNAFNRLFDFQKKREKLFLAKRLLIAFDIASALAYLHDLNIMYRDLKPTNVGFDVRNDAKLFDFGLATEFRPSQLNAGTFKLTGDTGTIRYMAPEVALSQPYTESADVYSFGILLWQICQLETPYGKLRDDAVERKVISLGFRPKIDAHWPNSIRRLLQDCFASSPRRPPMDVVCDVLRHELNQLSDKNVVDEEDLLDSSRSVMSLRYITP